MRVLVYLLFIFLVSPARAGFDDLIEAVKKDDIPAAIEAIDAMRLKEPADDPSWPAEFRAEIEAMKRKALADKLNSFDDDGRRPVFYVRGTQMLLLLLENGATLNNRGEVWRDGDGRTPLHFLLAVTAPSLLRERPPYLHHTIQIIEAIARLMMRAHLTARRNNDLPIEWVRDGDQQLPIDYLGGPDWTPDFRARLRIQTREYRPVPEGGIAGVIERREEREIQLQQEWQTRLMRERHAQWDAQLLERMTRDAAAVAAEAPLVVVEETLTPRAPQLLVMPTPLAPQEGFATPGLRRADGRRISCPQFILDSLGLK